MKHLSIKQIFVVLTIITLVMAALTLMSLLRVSADQTRVNNANNARYHSYLLADELRQSSDDLTRLARTYVVTGETRYEKQYNDILAIRNGAKARPEHYERIYWDLLAGGVVPQFSSSQAISLQQLMQQAGFSEQEFAKLKEAQDVSDALVKTEIIAMNAVKGWFDDGQGGFTRKAEPDTDMARRIMHDATYHRNKARIMVPLNEFLALLDQRTSNAVSEATQSERSAMMEAMALMILSILITILALYKVYDHIIRNLNQAISAAACIADGDLSREIKVDVKHEVGQLMEAIATINRNLHGMLSNIRSSTETMAVATQEIASGNTDLSSRTESQASSLEESASAMTVLTHTVQQNATSAQDANELAVHASAVAGKGGEAMQAVIHTMAEIKGSSAKISDIIAVIDSIAFQTNILALNAAVEAARAGEQGRGFAVVATEVRALAQRSKEAAQEITILIGDSVKRVERGSRLVDEAGLTMSDITNAVHRVSSILTSIAHASKEQGAGIAEVNMAVGQMEGITQQNAALVEQAAAAAESLREQAQTLLKTVSIFKLSHTARTRSVRMLS